MRYPLRNYMASANRFIVPPAPGINLSASAILETAANGTSIGLLSVVGGTGTYTFTVIADPDNVFTIDSDYLGKDGILDYESMTSHSVTIQADNGINPPLTRTFTISVIDVDDVLPAIVSFSPADNATGVVATVNLVATFNRPIIFGTGNITLKKFSDDSTIEAFDVVTEVGTGNGQVSIAGSVLTINPTATLAGITEFYVLIDATAIDDLAAHSFAGISSKTVWSFTTVSEFNGAQTLLLAETNGLAVDFTDNSMQIKDTVTPANNHDSIPFSKLTFTRAFAGSYYNSSGILSSAAVNIPRIDYNPATLVARGLLIEEARTNDLLWSNDFTNAAWTKDTGITVTAAQATGPDGATSLAKVQAVAGNNPHWLYNTTALASASRITTVYAKAGTVSWINISSVLPATDGVYFDLSSGVVGNQLGGSTGTIDHVGGGIYRCQANLGTKTFCVISIHPADSTSHTFTAAGTEYVYLGFCQAEVGAFPTSYIPTTTAAVTRAADVCSIATSAFNHSATLGTLYWNFTPMNVAYESRVLSMTGGSDQETVETGINTSAACLLRVVDGGTLQTAPLTTGTAVALTAEKMAASWAANDFAISSDGAAVATDTGGTLPTVTGLLIGAGYAGTPGSSSTRYANGWLAKAMHLPRAMSDAELAVASTT